MTSPASEDKNAYRSRLIQLVREREFLWNQKNHFFSNRKLKHQSWDELSQTLGAHPDKIRRTWENLRDQYRRDLKRQLTYGIKSKWRFYDDMAFIRSMVRIKEISTGNSESDSEFDTMHDEISRDTLSIQAPLTFSGTANMSAASSSAFIDAANFLPIQLSTEWRKTNEQDQQAAAAAAVAYQQRGQHVFKQMQVRQHYDQQMSQPKQEKQQKQQQNKCDSSDEMKYDDMEDMEDMVKIEIESDYDNDEPLSSHSQRIRSIPTTTTRIPANQSDTDACVSTSVSTTVAKRSRQQMPQNDSAPVKDEYSSKVVRLPQSQDSLVPDEDYHFVMSILPSLRQIGNNRKFPLRMSIMNLISKELERGESS